MSGAVFPTYIDDTQCDELLVCLVNPSRGRSLSKQRLSYRIMESISLAYGTKGLSFFLKVWKHIAPEEWHPHGVFLQVFLWMMFVLQLLDHHCTLLFGSIIWTWQSRQWFIVSSRLDLPCSRMMVVWLYIYLILCVYRVNCLKGYKLFCPQLLFPEGEELDTPPLCSWARWRAAIKTEGWLWW